MVKIPKDFDGQKFMDKFGVDMHDFRVDKDGLHCPSLSDITEADIADCVVDWNAYFEAHPQKKEKSGA